MIRVHDASKLIVYKSTVSHCRIIMVFLGIFLHQLHAILVTRAVILKVVTVGSGGPSRAKPPGCEVKIRTSSKPDKVPLKTSDHEQFRLLDIPQYWAVVRRLVRECSRLFPLVGHAPEKTYWTESPVCSLTGKASAHTEISISPRRAPACFT